jgi:transposase
MPAPWLSQIDGDHVVAVFHVAGRVYDHGFHLVHGLRACGRKFPHRDRALSCHRTCNGPAAPSCSWPLVELTDAEWNLVEDLFDPPHRRGARASYPRRLMVDALLFLARTGCQWRYLPDRYPPWPAVWQRWRENGRLGTGDGSYRPSRSPAEQAQDRRTDDGHDRCPDRARRPPARRSTTPAGATLSRLFTELTRSHNRQSSSYVIRPLLPDIFGGVLDASSGHGRFVFGCSSRLRRF